MKIFRINGLDFLDGLDFLEDLDFLKDLDFLNKIGSSSNVVNHSRMGIESLLLPAIIVVIAIIGIIIAAICSKKKKTYAEDASFFDGTAIQLVGRFLLAWLLSFITCGIATPWIICMFKRWEIEHTVINGRRLKFNGRGGKLFWRIVLWNFLSIITFGIFSLWYGVKLQKWVVKNTSFADDTTNEESVFTGSGWGWIGHSLLIGLSVFTLGIAAPFAEVLFIRWMTKNTVINGTKLTFKGTGGKLFVKYLVAALLTPITFGIYDIFFPIKYNEWKYSCTFKAE